jgi:hypothetical protein
MVELVDYPLDWYVKRLGRPFTFARYGDGEWLSILGTTDGQNCDKHPYSPALTEALRQSLTIQDDNYIQAIGPVAFRDGRQESIAAYLRQNKLNLQRHNMDVFLQASLDGQLFPLVDALRHSRFAYVGPAFLKDFVRDRLGVGEFIEVPQHNAFTAVDHLVHQIMGLIALDNPKVIGLSAGFATKVILSRLWPGHGRQATFLDFGSLWDGYVGRQSRSHVRRLTGEVIRQNLR